MERFKSRKLSNILKGMGSVLCLFPEERQHREIIFKYYKPHGSAAEALASDWKKVGESIYSAMGKVIAKDDEKPKTN